MLKGELVTLRGFTRADLPRLWEFSNDLEVELAGGGDPPMPQSLERLTAEWEQEQAKGGRDGATFVIEADGICIGQCGLRGFNETNRVAELGITIGDKAYWGRGYGRDAVRLLLVYGFRYRNVHRIWLWTNSNNERAIRSYLACGFKEEGRLREHAWSDGAYVDAVYMGVLRSEWEAARAS
jgi:RimJ/RimL family protein N-acetyltransferase